MSDKSRSIAAAFGKLKDRQHAEHAVLLKESQLLDEGFARLRADIDRLIDERVDELNREPEVGNILSRLARDSDYVDIDPRETVVSRSDLGATLVVTYDEHLHTVRFKVEKPVKYDYTAEVKTNGRGWRVVGGSKKDERDDTPDAQLLVERAINRLLGV